MAGGSRLVEAGRRLPADLLIVVGIVLGMDIVAVAPMLRDTPLRVVFGLPFLLVVPGYAVVAALFPERAGQGDSATDGGSDGREDGRIDGLERGALSIGMSIVLVVLVSLGLHVSPWWLDLGPLLASISVVTLVATVVAVRRRLRLPESERLHVPVRTWVTAGREDLFHPGSRTDLVLNVGVVVCVVLVVSGATYAFAIPKANYAFTEFYVLNETSDGELVANEYPTEFVRGEARPVVLGIENEAHTTRRYTVVVELQRIEIANDTVSIREERELDRLQSPPVPVGEQWRTTYDVRPTMTGRLRVAFLLYTGTPPAEPTRQNAQSAIHLRINVSSTNQ